MLLEQLSKRLESTIRKNSQFLTKTTITWVNRPSKKDEKADLVEVRNKLKNLPRSHHILLCKTRN